MSKNLMLLFKLLNIYLKNMNNYLLSHIALFTGRPIKKLRHCQKYSKFYSA